MLVFRDRQDAGLKLAAKLKNYQHKKPIILALPRGGVVVACEVAKALNASLDVLVVRKIGAPFNPEYAIGAIAEFDVLILNKESINLIGGGEGEVQKIINEEKKELMRRVKLYRHGESLYNVQRKTVILVDDGLATGLTAQAAIQAVRKLNPNKIVLAAPVCSIDTVVEIRRKVDDFICLESIYNMGAIGLYYQNFEQVTDREVVKMLGR